jgi:hypothetical protein
MPLFLLNEKAPGEYYDPIASLMEDRIEPGLAAPADWAQVANTVHIVSGGDPSVAYLVLPRYVLTGTAKGEISPISGEKLKQALPGLNYGSDNHGIILSSPERGDVIYTYGWSFDTANAIDSSDNARDPYTAMLCRFVDRRSALRQSWINQAYNVVRSVLQAPNYQQKNDAGIPTIPISGSAKELTIYHDTAYQRIDAPQNGSPDYTVTAWKWLDLLQDIWRKLPADIAGPFPLGFRDFNAVDEGQPPPTDLAFDYPLNRKYFGISAWDAFVEVTQDFCHRIVPNAYYDDKKRFFINGIEVVPVDKLNQPVRFAQPAGTEHDLFIKKLIEEGRLIGFDATHHNLFSLPEKIRVVFPDRLVDWQDGNPPAAEPPPADQVYPWQANTLNERAGYPIEARERNEHRPANYVEFDVATIILSLGLEPDPKKPGYVDVSLITYSPGSVDVIQAPITLWLENESGDAFAADFDKGNALKTEMTNLARQLVRKRLYIHFNKIRHDYIFQGFPAVAPTAEIESVLFDDKQSLTYVDCDWPPTFVQDQDAAPDVDRAIPYAKQIFCVALPDIYIAPNATGEMGLVIYKYQQQDAPTHPEHYVLPQGQIIPPQPALDPPYPHVEILNLSGVGIGTPPPDPDADPEAPPPVPPVLRVDWIWELDRWCVMPQGTGSGSTPQEPIVLPPTVGLDQNINYQLTVNNQQLIWTPPIKTLVRGRVKTSVDRTANTFVINNLVRLAGCGPLAIPPANQPTELTVTNVFQAAYLQGEDVVVAWREGTDSWEALWNANDPIQAIVSSAGIPAAIRDPVTGAIALGLGTVQLYTDGNALLGQQAVAIGQPVEVENWYPVEPIPPFTSIYVWLKSNNRFCIPSGSCKRHPSLL